MLFHPQIPPSSLQLFPHPQCGHLLHSLVVGRVDGGDALDVETGVVDVEILPGDLPGEAEGVGPEDLPPPADTGLYGV